MIDRKRARLFAVFHGVAATEENHGQVEETGGHDGGGDVWRVQRGPLRRIE